MIGIAGHFALDANLLVDNLCVYAALNGIKSFNTTSPLLIESGLELVRVPVYLLSQMMAEAVGAPDSYQLMLPFADRTRWLIRNMVRLRRHFQISADCFDHDGVPGEYSFPYWEGCTVLPSDDVRVRLANLYCSPDKISCTYPLGVVVQPPETAVHIGSIRDRLDMAAYVFVSEAITITSANLVVRLSRHRDLYSVYRTIKISSINYAKFGFVSGLSPPKVLNKKFIRLNPFRCHHLCAECEKFGRWMQDDMPGPFRYAPAVSCGLLVAERYTGARPINCAIPPRPYTFTVPDF
jgi:hypothetical protein